MKPRLVKIIFIDHLAFISFTGTIIGSLLGIVYRNIYALPLFPIIFFVASVLIFISFLLRLYYVLNLLKSGALTTAVIKKVSFLRDRGSIRYTYSYSGKVFSTVNTVMKNKVTKKLNQGMIVTILVNKKDPKKAIIKDLYYKSN